MQDHLDRNEENDKDGLSFNDNFAARILDSLDEAGDVQAIADLCTHLMPEQQEDLYKLLSKFDMLFMTSSRPLQTKKSILRLICLSHLTIIVLAQFLILTRQLSRRNSND